MNGKWILDAMENIQEEYIVSAQERFGYTMADSGRNRSRPRPVRRIFTVALAAVLVLACTLAAALAVSPDLREAVIALFQLGEAERVPGIPVGVNEVKQVTIGWQVSAQYVKLEGAWYADDGQDLLLRWYAEPESVWDQQPEHFYDLIDGELVEIGADASVTSAQLNWQGRDIDVQFRAFPYHDRLYICDVAGAAFGGDPSSGTVYPERLGSRTDVVVLQGECFDPIDTNWAWVCDPETGEVWDILAGCGVEELGSIRPVLFAEDLNHALVRTEVPYLVDLKEKTCTPLSERMGLDIPDTFGGCEVSFYDSDTVLLAAAPLWRPEPTSVWSYHIPSGTVTPTVTEEVGLTQLWSGNVYGWALAQQVDENGGVTILDLRTGGRVKLEGITITEGKRCYLKSNDALTKLLWAEWADDGSALDRLGVVNLETGVFTAFARENLDITSRDVVFWMGDDRVAVMMDLHSGEPYDSCSTDEYYLCVYEF